MQLPYGFIEMSERLLGEEAGAFLEAMRRDPVVSVRLNSRKPGADFNGARRVKWCDKGFYLPERPSFTLDPLLHAGAYYVQDASSMIYYPTVHALLPHLGQAPVRVLDLCAAPGGKTTAIIDALPDGSRVTANEYVGKRAGVLRENITKWGYPLASVTNRDSAWFASTGQTFDIVAVDAPCSGEGMMRKERKAVEQWSEELTAGCASLQREILANAASAVAPGGFLIYSTCTFNRKENEENAEFAAGELGLEPFDPAFPEEWGIPRGIGTELPVYRFMPHKTEGEGLFLAVFRKPGDFEPPRLPVMPAKKVMASPVPEMADILSTDFDRDAYPLAELDERQALAYLRRESITLSPDVPKGIVVVTYKGLPLGPVKNIGSRANNLYPKNWRILMR